MAHWIKCTQSAAQTIFVNLDNALTIYEKGSGSRISLLGDEDSYVDVKEAPAAILRLPRMGS